MVPWHCNDDQARAGRSLCTFPSLLVQGWRHRALYPHPLETAGLIVLLLTGRPVIFSRLVSCRSVRPVAPFGQA
jgi:hypothetical protein